MVKKPASCPFLKRDKFRLVWQCTELNHIMYGGCGNGKLVCIRQGLHGQIPPAWSWIHVRPANRPSFGRTVPHFGFSKVKQRTVHLSGNFSDGKFNCKNGKKWCKIYFKLLLQDSLSCIVILDIQSLPRIPTVSQTSTLWISLCLAKSWVVYMLIVLAQLK